MTAMNFKPKVKQLEELKTNFEMQPSEEKQVNQPKKLFLAYQPPKKANINSEFEISPVKPKQFKVPIDQNTITRMVKNMAVPKVLSKKRVYPENTQIVEPTRELESQKVIKQTQSATE